MQIHNPEAGCAEHDLVCAQHPAVDLVCKEVLSRAVAAVRYDRDAAALVLAGSLTTGRACGTVIEDRALLLSDIDLAVVPAEDASPGLRTRLAGLSAEVTRPARDLGLVSHLEFGLLSRRVMDHPRDSLFLHDLARTGITLAGDRGFLANLRARLAGRTVDAEEGRCLVLNRIAGQVYMLPHLASVDPLDRLVARYQFAKAYTDNHLALSIVKDSYHRGDFTHPVLEQQAEAARRWEAFRQAPPADPGSPARLLEEWKAVVQDQVRVAEAMGALSSRTGIPRPTHALAWSRLKGLKPTLREQLGMGGSPLQKAHVRCVELAREMLSGHARADWAGRAHAAVTLWRFAVNGWNDTPETYTKRVSELIRSTT